MGVTVREADGVPVNDGVFVWVGEMVREGVGVDVVLRDGVGVADPDAPVESVEVGVGVSDCWFRVVGRARSGWGLGGY